VTQRDSPLVPTRLRDDPARTAGLLFVVGAVQFLTVLMLAAAVAPSYDLGDEAISLLGVLSATALPFNVSLAVAGACNAAGGYALYRLHRARWLLGAYVATGVAAVGVAAFPLSAGAPHTVFAFLTFLSLNLEAVGTATRLRGPMRGLSLVAGVAGLVALLVLVAGEVGSASLYGPLGFGGVERLVVYPGMTWSIALGGYLFAPDAASAVER
jgi:hypothetical membrane protein